MSLKSSLLSLYIHTYVYIKVEASCIGSQAMVDCDSPHIYAALLPRTSIQELLPFLLLQTALL